MVGKGKRWKEAVGGVRKGRNGSGGWKMARMVGMGLRVTMKISGRGESGRGHAQGRVCLLT